MVKSSPIRRTRVLLDTNVLLLLAERFDVFEKVREAMREPYELVVLGSVLKELEKLAEGNGAEGRAAKLALAVVRKTEALKIVPGSATYADDALLANADGAVICTLDRELQRRAGRVLTKKGSAFILKEVS